MLLSAITFSGFHYTSFLKSDCSLSEYYHRMRMNINLILFFVTGGIIFGEIHHLKRKSSWRVTFWLKMEKVMLPFFVVTVLVTLCSGSRDPRIGGLRLEDEGEELLSRYLSPDARTKRDTDTDPKGTDLCNETQLSEVVSEHNACYKKAESQLTEALTSGERQFLLWLLIMLLEWSLGVFSFGK